MRLSGHACGSKDVVCPSPRPSIIYIATVEILVPARVRTAFPLGPRCGEGTAATPHFCKVFIGIFLDTVD